MKIGLVLEHFDPQRGGLERWTWHFAGRLAGLGHEVHVVACDFAEPAASTPLILHPVEPSSSPLRRAAAMEQTLRGLPLDVIHDLACGWHADLFHAQGGSSKAAHEQSLLRIPRWRQIRFWREKRYREQAEIERRQHSQEKALVVAVSQMDKRNFELLHGVPPGKVRLIYNGVDTDRFSPQQIGGHRESTRRSLGYSDAETVFLSVGYDLRRKNAETAIRALSRVVSEGLAARLLIVGGRRPGPFVQLARRLGIADRVTLLEGVEDVRPHLSAADAYVHPSWYDPCSIATLEALACALPVITTRANGVSELMTEGKNGFSIDDPGDAVSLAARMGEMGDPELRARMGAAARRLATEHTLDRQTGEFLVLYQEIAARKYRPVMPEEGP